ncbi:MAG: methylated-DNA--[protein]-cysteine S-methyltransferase [Caulobacteraceae bacterium]
MVHIGSLTTPIGVIRLASTDKGICLLSFAQDKDSFHKELGRIAGKVDITDSENSIIINAKDQLKDYFGGKLRNFSVPLDFIGTEFQKKVWGELLKIPYGELRCYGDIALKLGDMRYSRAVGSANSKNPIPIIVPCHRVIRKGRKISNYSGGLEVQKSLFRIEGIEYGDIKYII